MKASCRNSIIGGRIERIDFPENDNAHSLRMKNALTNKFGEEIVAEFAERYPLFKQAFCACFFFLEIT